MTLPSPKPTRRLFHLATRHLLGRPTHTLALANGTTLRATDAMLIGLVAGMVGINFPTKTGKCGKHQNEKKEEADRLESNRRISGRNERLREEQEKEEDKKAESQQSPIVVPGADPIPSTASPSVATSTDSPPAPVSEALAKGTIPTTPRKLSIQSTASLPSKVTSQVTAKVASEVTPKSTPVKIPPPSSPPLDWPRGQLPHRRHMCRLPRLPFRQPLRVTQLKARTEVKIPNASK